MAVKNREEMIAEMESLLSAAESGQFTPEDLTRFQDVVQCARDYVPEFEAGGEGEEEEYESEEEGEEMESPEPNPMPDLAALAGKAETESSPKRPPMLPPYKRREGR